jgi:lysyl-tRNA synthetase class 2
VSLAATELTVALGVVLVVLALGLARGQRLAWRLAVAALAVVTASHLVKSVDVEEAIVTGAVLAWLLVVGDRFRLRGPSGPLGRQLALLAAAMGGGLVAATAALTLSTGLAAAAALERVLGWLVLLGPAPTGRGERFVEAGTDALGLVGLLLALLLLVARARHRPGAESERVRARVLARGTDSLAYFALRDDKQHFLLGDSVVAYAVFGRVALISPDPIGPPGDLERTLSAFHAFATEQGWIVAILAAAPAPTDRYRRLGLRALYLGDEAIAASTTSASRAAAPRACWAPTTGRSEPGTRWRSSTRRGSLPPSARRWRQWQLRAAAARPSAASP